VRTDGIAENQHYVPKLLLRPHAFNQGCAKNKEKVWCFDKLDDRIFPSNIRGVAASRKFYDLLIDGQALSLEPFVTGIEDAAAPAFQQIVSDGSLSGLSHQQRRAIAEFCAVQLVRTEATRVQRRNAMGSMKAALIARGVDPLVLADLDSPDPDQMKLLDLRTVFSAPSDFAGEFINKHWYLVSATTEEPFYIGDNPLVLDNELDAQSGTGLQTPGVSISLPLTPTLGLGMVDPKLVEEMRSDYRKVRRLRAQRIKRSIKRQRKGLVTEPADGDFADTDSLYRDGLGQLLSGGLVPSDTRSTQRFNSLQTAFASRRVMSSSKDFSTARETVSLGEHLRYAPAFVVR